MENAGKRGILAVACTALLLFVPAYAQFQISPLAHLVMPAYGIDHAQFAILVSSTMILGIFLSLVAGLLCDKFGTRAVIGISAIASAIALIVRVFATDYATLFVCMTAAGFVATFINANVAKIMGSWFAPDKTGLAVGIAFSGTTVGLAVAMSTSALFDSLEAIFALTAILAVAGTIAWWVLFREGPYKSGSVEDDKSNSRQQPSLVECLKVAIKSRNVWLLGIVVALAMAATMCITTFLPQVLQTIHGYDPASAGALTSLFTFGNLAGTIVTPIVIMKLRRFKPVVIVMALVAALGTFFAWQLSSQIAMGVALFITGFAMNGIIAATVAQPILLPEIGPTYAGTAGGIVATLQLSGAVIIPSYIVVPLVGANYPVLYAIAAAFCVAAAAVVFGLPDAVADQAHVQQDVEKACQASAVVSQMTSDVL